MLAATPAPVRPEHPKAGVDYPSSFGQFLDWFGNEAACVRYLTRLRWPDGFSCPKCGHDEAWLTKRHIYVCSSPSCGYHASLLAGTIFEGTRLPLITWFRAIWLLTSSKRGISAKELQHQLDISYKTAWLMLQKLRLAMKRPGRDESKLTGDIEVDETYLGGPEPGGKRGRGAEGKLIIVVAAERLGQDEKTGKWIPGRARMRVIPDVQAKTLLDFVEDSCNPSGSVIYTDGLPAYRGLSARGFTHDATAISAGNDPAHVVLPVVHLVVSLLKRWLMGTHQGGHGAQHVEGYLDEWVFRFNRRMSRKRGLLFYRLLENAVVIRKLDYETIVWSRRPHAGKLRGPPRLPPQLRAPSGRAAAVAAPQEPPF